MSLLANAGTPLMWLSAGHLLFGNLVIGAFEGWILTRYFRFRASRALVCMVIANYLSFVAGIILIGLIKQVFLDTIENPPPVFRLRSEVVGLAMISFIATVLAEWPLVALAARGSPGPGIVKSFGQSLLIQCASYGLLVPAYSLFSSASLITVPELKEDLAFVANPSYRVYFVEPKDGSVVRMRLDGTGRETITTPGLNEIGVRLFVDQGLSIGRLKLLAVRDSKGEKPTEILADVGKRAEPMPSEYRQPEPDTGMNFSEWGLQKIPDLRDASARRLVCHTGFWAGSGLRVMDNDTELYRLAFENYFFSSFEWTFRNAVALPGDQVLVQVKDQLLILDMPSRTLGFLTYGRGPVVVAVE